MMSDTTAFAQALALIADMITVTAMRFGTDESYILKTLIGVNEDRISKEQQTKMN